MAEIILSGGFVCRVDDADMDRLVGRKWRVFKNNGIRYAACDTKVDGKRGVILMHRLLLDVPPGQIVDHADGDGLNNSRANIRVCTYGQNMCNKRVARSNALGLKNISVRVGRGGVVTYRVEVKRGVRRLRASFTELEGAMAFAQLARAELHGAFATDEDRLVRHGLKFCPREPRNATQTFGGALR